MAEFAPAAIKALFDKVKREAPSSWRVQLSGIVGDRLHTYGYHRARNVLPGGDYSRQLKADREGNGDAASAVDITMSPEGMRKVTANLIKSAEDPDDPRMEAVREFFGTTNSSSVNGRRHDGGYTWYHASSDSSHLWHVHVSFLRKYAQNKEALSLVADVMLGKPYKTTTGGSAGEGDNEVQLDDKVKLFNKPDVKYSSKEVSLATLLASTNYYTLQSRNLAEKRADKLEAELKDLKAQLAQVLELLKGK